MASRRIALTAIAVAMMLVAPANSAARAQPQQVTAQMQSDMQKKVNESADAIAASARLWLGNLHPQAQVMFKKWLLAVRAWRAETRDSAVSLLAEGTLLDCYGRTLGLQTNFGYGLAADQRFEALGLPGRLDAAAEAFDKALERDRSLREAEFRRAHIRAGKDARAVATLERLAAGASKDDVAYLAAISRGQLAQGRKDVDGAVRWFELALTIRRSTAAAIALSTLRPSSQISFDAIDGDDIFYTYPCTPLTPGVAAELGQRIEKTVIR